MKRAILLAAVLAAAVAIPVHAQQTGALRVSVKDKMSGEPLPGAQVSLQGTRLGGITNDQGMYMLLNVPVGTYTVNVTFLGFSDVRQSDVEIVAGQTRALDVQMEQAVLSLQEVVVSGVTDPTAGIKLPFTVARVGAEQLQVPASNSALESISGKVAGASIIPVSGQPGEGVNIMLRSPTGFESTNSPLIVVDGVVISRELGGTSVDIESLDIENIEVIKGAAAASLYGSRAASGVISITTNRGRGQSQNLTKITSRTELGASTLSNEVPVTRAHHYEMNEARTAFVNSAGRDTTWNGKIGTAMRIQDMPYPGKLYDNVRALYNPGNYLSQNFTVSQNTENTTFMVSLTRHNESGALEGNDGFWRNTGRLSLDHRIGQKVSISLTGQHVRSWQDVISGTGNLSPFASILIYPLYVDLSKKDETGQYVMQPDPTVEMENPLWRQRTREHYDARARTLASLSTRYSPTNWVTLDAQISYDRADSKYQEYVPKGVPLSVVDDLPATGYIYLQHRENDTSNGSVGATFNRQFGDLNARLTTRGTFEKEWMERFTAYGSNLLVKGVRDLSAARTMEDVWSETRDIRANGYLADVALDFKERYIASVLVRRDGSSLFGPLNRWHTYKRASAAYLISREEWFNIPGINELKLRYAMGEAGGRPEFHWQYEAWNISRITGVTRENAGNPSLKPQFTREQEVGLDIIALNNRLQLELVYAHQKTTDQMIIIPATVITGFSSMRANAAEVKGRTYEASLQAYPVRTRNFTWSVNAVADNSDTRLVEWNRSCFWGSNAGREHEFTCAGERAGDFYVKRTVRSVDELPSWLRSRADEFAVNDDGYLVWVGKDPATGQTNSWQDGLKLQNGQCAGAAGNRCGWGASFSAGGQTYRWGEPFRAWNENYDTALRVNGGSSLPDVNYGFGTNVRYKGFSTYLGFGGQIGGKIYNRTKHWYYAQYRHGDLDQTGKPDELKKSVDYYARGLAENDTCNGSGSQCSNYVDAFLEDGTYLKLREATVRYRFTRDQLSRLIGRAAPSEVQLGINGRNLFNLTNFTGFDPEAGSPLSRVEHVNYPKLRRFTATVDITF